VRVTEAGFVEMACAPAVCRCAGAADRGSATRVLFGRREVPPEVMLPDASAVAAPGRVHGLGSFRAEAVRAALADALPPALRDSLRATFEWYACRGAFFHNDAHYGEVLFGAWCVAGPPREIAFARAGLRLPAGPGDWVVFDPFEPHAVLDGGADRYRREDYDGAPASVFIGFELQLDEPVRRAFGIGPPRASSPVLASSVAIHAESGALA
jgi:hypothetical protein